MYMCLVDIHGRATNITTSHLSLQQVQVKLISTVLHNAMDQCVPSPCKHYNYYIERASGRTA